MNNSLFVIERARVEDAAALLDYLEVRSDNIRAIRLYEKIGFRKLCTFPRFFKINGESIDFDLMNLELEGEGC